MKVERKTLTLHVEYGYAIELEETLRKVIVQLRNRQSSYNRSMHNTAIYEWRVESAELKNYKEELINGQWCQVYQSKINTNG